MRMKMQMQERDRPQQQQQQQQRCTRLSSREILPLSRWGAFLLPWQQQQRRSCCSCEHCQLQRCSDVGCGYHCRPSLRLKSRFLYLTPQPRRPSHCLALLLLLPHRLLPTMLAMSLTTMRLMVSGTLTVVFPLTAMLGQRLPLNLTTLDTMLQLLRPLCRLRLPTRGLLLGTLPFLGLQPLAETLRCIE